MSINQMISNYFLGWLDAPCTHQETDEVSGVLLPPIPRRRCERCWAALMEMAEKGQSLFNEEN